MFRFIHCADIHLDSPLKGLRFADEEAIEQVRKATRRALENLVDVCVQEEVNLLVIAGDVFDGDWEDYTTGLFFGRCMKRLADALIPVVLIRGNHDAASVLTKHLSLPENVRVLSEHAPETVRFESLRVAVHGQSFADRAVTMNLAVNYPAPVPGYFNIGLLHTGLAGREDHANYAPCQVSDLLNLGYDYFALGHIHKPEIVHDHPPIVFPGNIQGRHIRETGERGCVLVEVDDAMQPTLRRIPLDVLRWYELSCSLFDVNSESLMLAKLREEVSILARTQGSMPLCLRIRITDVSMRHAFIHRDRAHITAQVLNSVQWGASQAVYVEKVVFEDAVDEVAASIEEDVVDDLQQALVQAIQDEKLIEETSEELQQWHRNIASKMQTEDAPHSVQADLVEQSFRRAFQELSVILSGEGDRKHEDF